MNSATFLTVDALRNGKTILERAYLHITPYDGDASAILSQAMDRVDNEIARVKRAAKAKRAASRIAVVCLECRKRFTVSASNVIPECPKCGGVDIDVRE